MNIHKITPLTTDGIEPSKNHKENMSKGTIDTSNLVTCLQIANSIERSEEGVRKAIVRLGIKPTLEIGRCKYYDKEYTKQIEKSMRGKNKA